MLPACLHFGVLRCTNPDKMFPPNMDLADGRQESARDRWVQQQMEELMRHLPADLEVLPFPPLLEQMECEAVQRTSPPTSLVTCPDPAVKPASFSRHRKRRRGAFPCLSAGEEEFPTAVTSGAVVSLPANMKAAVSIPTSSSATAPSPRLAAALPMPSSLAPVRGSVSTPGELEERLKLFARLIKSFRRTSLLYSSRELMEKIRKMEEDYWIAIRQFYCRSPPSSSSLQGLPGIQQETVPHPGS
ncbi:hypothetical protein CHARACLAT_032219 [Characodon lateralis]|uniref:Uncharacterized protein n=1 Tax=Characodon lateralis TaxID=208331 RepID=A0ABU7CT36_9TELE|nr:hypothetical protein [Characodon lateralis]